MSRPILEVIACSVADAVAAERGGADRLEIISHYEVGGLTPPIDLVERIMAAVKLPLRVMVRDQENFFVTDQKKIERLSQAARSLSDLCVDGLVLGFLKDDPGGTVIDHELVGRILAGAPKLKATFHRAFEELSDPLRSIAELKRHAQIDHILTSGGSQPWLLKTGQFAVWQEAAQPEIAILAGGGVDHEAIMTLRRSTMIREFHVGVAAREGGRVDGAVTEHRVRELIKLLNRQG